MKEKHSSLSAVPDAAETAVEQWCVARRFADFVELRESLLSPALVPDPVARNLLARLPFPPKTGLLVRRCRRRRRSR